MEFQLLFTAFQAQPAHARWPQQRQLHECLRQGIRSGTLASGARLPASRALAAELGVARNSVLYAYEQLASEGFIVATRRGSVVAPLTRRLAASAPRHDAPAQRASLSRRAQNMPLLPGSETAAAFAPGVPALGEFPVLRWRRMLDRAWASLTPAQLNYADPAGEPALREAIAGHLRVARGALVDAAQVFITDGTQSSLDLVARAFADAGDKVWVENPGYQGAVAAFRAAQLKTIGIVVDAEGMAPTASDWLRQRPRLIYTTPSHQYPVGSVLSLARRLALIDGARQAGALVVEDDYDSEFRHDGPPLACMQGLAVDAPVVYLGTFSKTLFRRCAWASWWCPRRWLPPCRKCWPGPHLAAARRSSWRWPSSSPAVSSACTCGACAACTDSAAMRWWPRSHGTWAMWLPCTAARPACTWLCACTTARPTTWR